MPKATQIKIIGSTGASDTDPDRGKYQLNDELEIDAQQHKDLVAYVKLRLDFAKSMHVTRVERFKDIDKEVAGYMVLDDDDRERQRDNTQGYGPKVHDVNIPLTATQMDEAVTFFTTVFFPEEGPYNAVTEASKEQIAKGFSRLMNQHATYYKHFTNFAKTAYSGLKYNIGYWLIEWNETKGAVMQNAANGVGVNIEDDAVVMTGNELEWLSAYNTLVDPSVHPTEIHSKGEFFAYVEPQTAFRAKLMAERGEIFNLDRIIDKGNGDVFRRSNTSYYTQMPEIHGDLRRGTSGGRTDWFNFLSGSQSSSQLAGVEMVHLYIWLPAYKFGMSDSKMYQIWRVTLADMTVVRADRLTNAHGFLPLAAIVPWDDEFGVDASSFAEMLLPYQRFSSFQINIHQRASRKALYNLTVYNSRTMPQMANADVLGGKVPFNPTADENDINKAVKQFSDTPDTSGTLRDIEAMDGLMQKILPTDILKQVSSLERATQYQAAATVQGANRRNLKIAKVIDTQGFSVARKVQMYNILQFQQSMSVLGEDGVMIEIDPTELRNQKYEFTISDGLRGLDKLILIETIKDILALLVQNPTAAAEFDIAAMIDYVTTLIGDHTSFAQFRHTNEFDKLAPEQKQMAFQLLQKAMQNQAAQEGGGQPQ